MQPDELINNTLLRVLAEDVGHGDITTSLIVPEGHRSRAVLIAKQDLTLAGIPFVERVFRLLDPDLRFRANKKDGDTIKAGSKIASLNGKTKALLTAERTALNLLQRLSGIATLTRRFVEEVKDLPVKIVDTRKTTPGLRHLEKYAVRVGGGANHRHALYDGILIKDNHIAIAGSIKKAVELARSGAQHMLKIEVEVNSLQELEEAISARADIIMLDNMPIQQMRKAVRITRLKSPQTILEASGNINIQNVRDIAQTGVDLISIGALTHSAPAVDISMEIK